MNSGLFHNCGHYLQMEIKFNKPGKNADKIRYLSYAIIALLLSIIHVLFLDIIEVGGFTPDLLLILTVWICLSEGRFTGLIAGFLIGLLFDVISSDVIGTNALSKTVVAFIAGSFYKEGKTVRTIGSVRFLMVVFLCSIVHNIVYFFFYIKLSDLSYFSFFLEYGVAISLYTTVFAVFAMLIKIPMKGT